MDTEKKLYYVKRNTEEIITEEELKELLQKKEQPSVYLGTAVTGRPHLAYFVWVLKLADFLKAGFKVKLLMADIHGALDNTPWDILEKRYDYYSAVIPLMFSSIGADIKNFEIVKGSSFQLEKKYMYDVLKMSTFTTVHDCNKAASEVVKNSDNPKLSGLLYPILQSLDEEYLGVDIQYGGIDQRKILMFARENLPKVGYKSRVEVMTPIIPGLVGKKMSASVKESKIDLLDDQDTVKSKIKKAYCPEGELVDNGVMAFFKHFLMFVKEDKGEELLVERPEKFGGNLKFSSYEELEKSFVAKELHPMDLKACLVKEIDNLLEPIRQGMKNKSHLTELAYPEQ